MLSDEISVQLLSLSITLVVELQAVLSIHKYKIMYHDSHPYVILILECFMLLITHLFVSVWNSDMDDHIYAIVH